MSKDAPFNPPDFRHVDCWIFDLDNTLYPLGSEVQAMMDERIATYVRRVTGLPRNEARALQKRYLHEHGTSLAGLMAHHGIEPHAYLEEVHDISLDSLTPDAALVRALDRLPGRRLVFTNASAGHAERVLAKLGLKALFEDVFHIEAAELTPKPNAATYDALVVRHGVTPARAAFFEDSATNLAPAHRLGMTTVLVGPHAADCASDTVDYRAAELAPFLDSLLVAETA